jgi:hypothetical protein
MKNRLVSMSNGSMKNTIEISELSRFETDFFNDLPLHEIFSKIFDDKWVEILKFEI